MQHFIDVEADGTHPVWQVLKTRISRLVPGSFITLISPEAGEGMLQLLGWLKQQGTNPCHLWIAPQATVKDAWVKQLRSRGITCYPLHALAELPGLLGGRNP